MATVAGIAVPMYIVQQDQSLIFSIVIQTIPLQWRHDGRDSVSNHQPRECLLSRLIRRRSKKTSNIRVTGLYAGNSPETGEFPAQRASNTGNVSIWWRHHVVESSLFSLPNSKGMITTKFPHAMTTLQDNDFYHLSNLSIVRVYE